MRCWRAMEKRPFTELGLSAETLKAVAQAGYEVATPIQSQGIPVLLEGKDLVGHGPGHPGPTAGGEQDGGGAAHRVQAPTSARIARAAATGSGALKIGRPTTR